MSLYKNKYRIESTRLKGWDYSSNGYYFVTICTKNRECFFGNIVNGKVELSEIGKIVADEWQRTEQIRKNVKLDEWIIMPNHMHSIVIINNDDKDKSSNLSSIIRGFKSASTNRIHTDGYSNFGWQSRFYDHIIRNEEALQRIREYIINNPTKWELDKMFVK